MNVAGLVNRTPVEDITEAEWDLLNDVNLKAPFFVAQQAYRVMVTQGRARSSTSPRTGRTRPTATT